MSNEGVAMPKDSVDLIADYEQFYGNVDLKTAEIYCGDDRSRDTDINLFGGAGNVPYTLMVLQEEAQTGSVEQKVDEAVASLVPVLKEKGIRVGVHSDEGHEPTSATEIDPVSNEGLGCKWLEARQAVSEVAASNVDKIITILEREDPGTYANDHTRARVQAICAAHGRLAERNIHVPGRKIAAKAMEKGAPSIVLGGDHYKESDGFLNKRMGTTFHSEQAAAAGKPAYDHDSWAAKASFDEIHDLYPYDKKDFEIANDIDAVATLLALGVQNIAVRR